MVDQKRGHLEIKPGYHLVIRTSPKIVEASKDFKKFDAKTRSCRFNYETEGFHFLQHYSKAGCEMECAIQQALKVCKCLPWFYTNNFTEGLYNRQLTD